MVHEFLREVIALAREKMIDLSTTLSSDLGEIIECIDEKPDDEGEEFNLFQEDNDEQIVLDGKIIKKSELSDDTSNSTARKIFEFSCSEEKNPVSSAKNESDAAKVNISENTSKTYGVTTPRDGEAFTIKRGYQFRESTLKKLNELKAHAGINTYFNEIIDTAICYYYDAVFKNKK